MAELYEIQKPEGKYYDRKNYNSLEEYNAALAISATVYVGNLSIYTTQDTIRELFSTAGKVAEIIMGIDDTGTPCGFCFVIYQTRGEAMLAVEYISKTKLNDRIIRVDWDPGYKVDREKGRGTGGQQRRDDFRTKQDAERPKKRQPERSYDNKYQKRQYKQYDRNERSGQYKYENREKRGQNSYRTGGDRGDREKWNKPDRYERGYNRDDRDRSRTQKDTKFEKEKEEIPDAQAEDY